MKTKDAQELLLVIKKILKDSSLSDSQQAHRIIELSMITSKYWKVKTNQI